MEYGSLSKIKTDEMNECVLRQAIDTIDPTKFYVLHMGETLGWQHFVAVRTAFWSMMMTSICEADREALVRIYISDYSQNNPASRIKFGNMVAGIDARPAHVDLDAEMMHKICMIDFENCTSDMMVRYELCRIKTGT